MNINEIMAELAQYTRMAEEIAATVDSLKDTLKKYMEGLIMKNQYSKFVKYLEKQENIFFQRKDDSVYLTDGKAVLMVPDLIYNSMVRPLSGLFPDVSEDCIGVKYAYDPVVKIFPDGMNISKAVENISTEKLIRQSRFLLELPQTGKSKKSLLVRIFKADDGDIIAVNNVFVDMFADCSIAETWTGAGRWNAPLVKKSDGFMQVMFPVQVDQKYFETWKDLNI